MWGNDAEQREFGEIWPLWQDAGRRDHRRAVQRLRKLADQGYAPAQYALGWAYFDGEGVRRDYVKAFEYILAAANQKYPAAEGMVGAFYAMVKPKHGACPHDPAEAVRWYRRGAEHGNIGAMVNLATCYKSGLGIDEDPSEVYVWASLAVCCSSIRNRPAEVMRDEAATYLDTQQRALADKHVAGMSKSLMQPWADANAYWKSLWQECL